MQGRLVTIFGGGGFVGRYVAQALLASGARVRIAVRDTHNAQYLKPLGNLGAVQLVTANVLHKASVARAVAGADAVVNLVGIFGNAMAMDAVNNGGARNVAEAAAAASVGALVHLSAIGADSDSASDYGRSKAAGEIAVGTAFPDAVILRPSIIFGREDQFINRFANLIRMAPVVPVIGGKTKFQPVYVGDVAKAVVAAIGSNANGETLELGGPEALSMLELNQWIAKAIGRERGFVEIPDVAAAIIAKLPLAPISSDQFKMLASDNVVSGTDGLAALGIAPTPIDAVAHDWLHIYRKHGRFGTKETSGATA